MKNTLFLFISLILFISGQAQDSSSRSPKEERRQERRTRINTMIRQEEEGVLSYTRQTVGGLELRTNGVGAFLEIGRRRSPRFTNLYSLELSDIRHPKEEKIGTSEGFFSNSFIYGKINSFYQAKLGFGQQYIFGQKGNKNGVAVTGSVTGGLALGFLKPYYLEILDSVGQAGYVKYSQQDSVRFLTGAIIDNGGLFRGFNEVQLKPGLFVRTALRFDFGRYNESIQALEIGLSMEGYAQKIPIMLFTEPKQLFFQGHIAFVFGRRR